MGGDHEWVQVSFGGNENIQKLDYCDGYTLKISKKNLVVLNFTLNLIVLIHKL